MLSHARGPDIILLEIIESCKQPFKGSFSMHMDEALRACDVLMSETVSSDVPLLEDASRHILQSGGKRIRPRVLFLAYESVGGADLASAVPLAAAVELVHTATLVHDDINDHGHLRRGRETVNERWGQTLALLTGDYLFTRVYSLMAPFGDLNRVLAEATVALVEGETLQAVAAQSDKLSREVYQQIVAKKTASLFRAAGLLGAPWGGGDQKSVDALGDYGFYLGLVFQIVDDLLDLTGDSRLMGKEARVDVAQGKGVAAAYAQGQQGGNGHSREDTAVAELTLDDEPDDRFLAIKRRLIAGGAVEEGRQMAQVLAAQARASLGRLSPNPVVDELDELVSLVLERDH
jgi:geranylgeranyl pyrophosphate synthase